MKFIYTINKSHPVGRQKHIEQKKKKDGHQLMSVTVRMMMPPASLQIWIHCLDPVFFDH
jgi:hypothetical protein